MTTFKDREIDPNGPQPEGFISAKEAVNRLKDGRQILLDIDPDPSARPIRIQMVPECQTCQHWDRHPDNAYPSPTGTCKVIPHPNEHAAGRGLTTSPDFGCVKWESKT